MNSDSKESGSPRLIAGRGGRRLFTTAALAERIRAEFMLEYAGTEALRAANTPGRRMRLILDVTDYLIAVEAIAIDSDEKAGLMRRVYSELFGYGALDPYFADPRVTTIALHGPDHAAVRYGHADLVDVPALFEDADQMFTILERLLTDAGAVLRGDIAVIETGMVIGSRRASISVTTPTFGVGMSADIRLHPSGVAPTLNDLTAAGVMTDEAAAVLLDLARSSYGVVIAGESETGKTTLLNALAQELDPPSTTAVERTGEMRLDDKCIRFKPSWGAEEGEQRGFAEAIRLGIGAGGRCLLIDEVRSDEPTAVAPLLLQDDAPRQWWAFRGAPDHKRLQSALGMLARRADPASGEAIVHRLYDRLPFVVSVARIQGKLRLFSIAEWQTRIDSEYPDYVQLFRYDAGAARRTEAAFARWL